MGENDFTELVVAEGTGPTNDIAKTSLQALFSKQSKTNSKALPLSDVCFTLVRQIDVIKQSTKFLLKQLLMNGSAQGRNVAKAMRYNEQLKNQMTQLKQDHSTQRLQYEQLSNDLNNKLKARENTIRELNLKLQEKDKILSQFRNMHSGGGRMATPDCILDVEDQFGSNNRNIARSSHPGGNNSLSCDNLHQASISNMSSSNARAAAVAESSSSTMLPYAAPAPAPPKPPLQGLLMKRSAQQAMQQKAFHTRRGPTMSSGVSVQSSITGMSNIGNGRLGSGGIVGHGALLGNTGGPVVAKRFSSSSAHSTGSNSLNSATPRVRDLSHSATFSFSGGSTGNNSQTNNIVGKSGSGAGGHHPMMRLNKRRRVVAEATPLGNHIMSPNTAFALNQGNYSANSRGQRW